MSLITVDSNGQAWSITVNPDGSMNTTPVSGAGTPTSLPTGNDYTVTLQSVVNLASTHNDLMPLANVGGYVQEPALSLANDTIQELLSSPYDWKFNGKTASMLFTAPYRQDYLFAGASIFVPSFGGVAIGLASANGVVHLAGSSLVTVKTMQPHNFTVGQTAYMLGNDNDSYNSKRSETINSSGWTNGWVVNSIIDDTTLTLSIGFPAVSDTISGAPGINDFGWLEHATMFDASATDPVPYEWTLDSVKSLKRSSDTGRPRKIAVISRQNGVLTFRLTHRPQTPAYAITPHYQMKAPLKTDLSQNWYPFPDELGFCYRQAFLARCYRYLDKPKADNETVKAEAMIAKALGKDDVEESDQSISPAQSLMEDAW